MFLNPDNKAPNNAATANKWNYATILQQINELHRVLKINAMLANNFGLGALIN